MLSEVKILFNNIKNFRHLITEGVSNNDIVDAINNHEYVYIYYTGDDKNQMGYRTIRPYVLGTHKKSGNTVLRAWQDNKRNSYHFINKPTRKDSLNHDYWIDYEGQKPGWRMFRLDKISKVYPTGKKFHDENGLVMIPAGYHEGGDDDMGSIIAYVSTKTQPDFDYKYDKEFYGDKLSRADLDKQKWDSIRKGNKDKREITASDVTKLSDIASRVYKKGRGSFLVAIDDKNNFQLISAEDKEKKNIPDSAVVGGLANLYNTLVKPAAPLNKAFFDTNREKAKSDMERMNAEIKETKIPTIPFEKKTFFK